jgi:hypothetical protein
MYVKIGLMNKCIYVTEEENDIIKSHEPGWIRRVIVEAHYAELELEKEENGRIDD